MPEDITRTVLPNGLTVQIKEIHTAPIISHWLWYRVGSRDELTGLTGSSHWVEHMQFKGTPRFPSSVLDKAIAREGGAWNAFTYLDWTTYYETMPADKIDLALNLEADRMVNSLFDPAEVAAERTVIISEREGDENEPLFRLGEAIQSSAFTTHPYQHEVIGSMEDLHHLQRDDLYAHYRHYYCPNNAILAIAGDCDATALLAQINELYSAIPAGPEALHPAQPEEHAVEEKRLEIQGPGETTFLELAYHAPASAQPDFFAFSVVDSLLAGPTSLNMFGGGGISNKTSRLYRALVEKERAVSVHGGLQATIDPYLYDMIVTVRPECSVANVLGALDDEIKRLQDGLVKEEEIARAIKQARAMFAYGSENITNQAFWMGHAEMFASYDWFIHYVDRLAAVTPVDVQRIAQTYLLPTNRVVGIYLPNGEKESEA